MKIARRKESDVSQYVQAVADSAAMLAEIEAEELAAAVARIRFNVGEITAARYRDEVGEAALRSWRIRNRLDEAARTWTALVAERDFPPMLQLPIERNAHRIGAVHSRIEGMERESVEAVEEDARLRREAYATPDQEIEKPSTT